MKRFKNIFYLGIFVAAIIGFWLVPNINTAKESRYTLVENREVKPEKVNPFDPSIRSDQSKSSINKVENQVNAQKAVKKKARKKEDVIESSYNFEDMKMCMFSRAAHFRPEQKLPTLVDTAITIPADTVVSVQ
jgi:hypothetical protein